MTTDTPELLAILERARQEMIAENVNGWPNAVLLAIEALQPKVSEQVVGEDIDRDIRIAIWNAAMAGGMGQDLSQAMIRRAMDEPLMKRALAALSSPPSLDREQVARITPEVEAAFLIALAEHGIDPSTQELLIRGDGRGTVAPGALRKALRDAIISLSLLGGVAYSLERWGMTGDCTGLASDDETTDSGAVLRLDRG